jgi:pyruvate/oxaloacetate carboxyltransferase
MRTAKGVCATVLRDAMRSVCATRLRDRIVADRMLEDWSVRSGTRRCWGAAEEKCHGVR